MTQLDWNSLVFDALERRKEEKISQKQHALLANVSIPTLISFERAETSISIEKVLAILGVVGMVAKPKPPANKFDTFIAEASSRWFELTKSLDKDSPARHPLGHISYAIEIEGDLKEVTTPAFHKILQNIAQTKYSGWSPFGMPTSEDTKPYAIDNQTIECWIGGKRIQESELRLFDPSTTDFWRASRKGYMYLQRGYVEDSHPDILRPGQILDLSKPIKLAAEIICYGHRLANAICTDNSDSEASINLRARYTGLQCRTLSNWSDPSRPLFDNKRIAISDTAAMTAKFRLQDITEPLHESVAKIVYLFLKELYAKFGFYEPQYEFVEEEVRQMLLRRF